MESPLKMTPQSSSQISPLQGLPLLLFYAPPHLLHICRSLETGYESPIRSLEEQDFIDIPVTVTSPTKISLLQISALVSEKVVVSLPATSPYIPPSPQGAWKVPMFIAPPKVSNSSQQSPTSSMAGSSHRKAPEIPLAGLVSPDLWNSPSPESFRGGQRL